MIKGYDGSLYGNFRQIKFTDAYTTAAEFLEDYKSCGIPTTITDDTATTLYYLLYARYGNSVFASSDINRAKYQMWSIIFSYGPAWEKRLDIQKTLREMTEDELVSSATTIYNHAYNPSTAPTTSTLDELQYINEQNTQKNKRGKLDAYSFLWDLLDIDVTSDFLRRFQDLFIRIVQPELPLWYTTTIEED